MKTPTKSFTFLLVFIFSFNLQAQVQDSVFYNRLFYTCKVWGHVKYYHTETARGVVNWDNALLAAYSALKNAPDNDAFNHGLLQMLNSAGEMGTNANTSLPAVAEDLNNNSDYSWIQSPIFSDSVRAALDTIRSRFRPQNNFYVRENWAEGPPTFDSDVMYQSEEDFPSEEKRVLALFRYWNIINYFFPYKDIMDQGWEVSLREFIPQIVEAPDAQSYHLAFKKLTTRINDSHAFFTSPSYTAWLGNNYPPFLTRFVENEMIITKVLPTTTEVAVGDIVKEIDGIDVYHLRDSLREYAHGSNDAVIERELNDILLAGSAGPFSIAVDDGSAIRTHLLNRNSSNIATLLSASGPVWRDTTIAGSCYFGIVDMGQLEVEDISTMFADLWDTDAIVFDVRNHPNGTLWTLVDYLFSQSLHIASFTVPDKTYPGRLVWKSEYIGNGTSAPYQGKIIILFDERTQSQAEYTCMGLEQFPEAIKIGSTTSGADGNVSQIYLPGKIITYATFLGVFYPDGTPTQRIGIIPDHEVHPSISGIRSGQDEVLSFALNCELLNREEQVIAEDIKLYPTPARLDVNYELAGEIPVAIDILDMQGRKITSIKTNASAGSFDVSNLKDGAYVARFYVAGGTKSKLFVKQH